VTENLEDCPYSNRLEWIGQRQGELVDREFIEAYFPDLHEYWLFIDDFLVAQKLTEDLD
jgi:hypothetical protein